MTYHSIGCVMVVLSRGMEVASIDTHIHPHDFQISYENKQITKAQNIKFLGIIIDSNLSWKHFDDIIPKLNKACFFN